MYINHKDNQLVELAQYGDAHALAVLHDRHWQAIYTYIYYRVFDQALAEDLTADVFVRMVEAIDRYQDRGKTILPWLYTISKNRVTDYFRKNGKEPSIVSLEENPVIDNSDPEETIIDRSDIDCVKSALKHLTELQRQVVIGKFIEGRSNREVAELIDRSEGSIKSLQHRALAALRRIIEKEKCYEI